jgi:hypothetical protein
MHWINCELGSKQAQEVLRIRIRIIFGSPIRIGIRLKSRIRQSQNRIRILIKVEIQQLWRLKMEPWRTVGNEGVDAWNEPVDGL